MVVAKPERRRVRRRKTRSTLDAALRHAIIILATAICVYTTDIITGHDVLGIAKLVGTAKGGHDGR